MLLLSLLGLASASPPDAAWRTIHTEHYRLHYPTEAEAWATAAASRLESMHARVEGQVGFEMVEITDVVVRDPVSDANGMALPFLKGPRMELWVTPPGADSAIGWNRRWDEGLIVHEAAHLVHMARPARGGVDKLVDGIVGVGPVARKSPRWVIEGYATVVEGDQTGFGRPFSDQQAASLRRMAREGLMPAYGELDGSDRWLGGGFAYQVGSAYLTWLRDRAGADSLRHLWLRLSSVESRTFEEGFEGVFGDQPDVLYGRFVAELTRDGMSLDEAMAPTADTRWVDLKGHVGAPAVSPNGERVAWVQVVSGRARLQVHTTDEDDEAVKARDEARKELAELDPEDIADPLPAEPLLERTFLRTRKDRGPRSPRWLDDDTLLFVGGAADGSGRVRTDIYRVDVNTGRERRVTRWQDVRDVDPAPDGSWAVAARWSWGASGIVRVDLDTGELQDIVATSVDVVHDNPRVSPDGKRVVWVQMAQDRWRLMVHTLGGSTVEVPTPEGASLAHPTWRDDGVVLVAGALDGVQEIWSVPLDGGAIHTLTRSFGAATSPEPSEDHLYYLDRDSRGLDVHRVEWSDATSAPLRRTDLPSLPEGSLVLTPQGPTVSLPSTREVTSTGYGLGRFEGRMLAATSLGFGDGRSVELGYRGGDLLGRHELLVLGSWGSKQASRGGRATWAVRTLPVTVQVGGFAAWDGNSGVSRAGGDLQVSDTHRWNNGVLRGAVGGIADPSIDGEAAYLGYGDLSLVARTGGARFFTVRLASGVTGGQYGGGTGAVVRARGALWLGGGLGFAGRVMQRVGDAPTVQLGGVPSLVLPVAWQRHRLQMQAWNRGTLQGDRLVSMSAHIGNAVRLSGERTVAWTDGSADEHGASLVDLSVRREVKANPLVKLPITRMQAGVGCRLENPVEGVRGKPCTQATDWALWLRVGWFLE